MNEEQIKNLIDQRLSNSFVKKIGDTPTDALQLANKKYVDGKASKVYFGVVASDGSAINLPSGWTSSRTGTGDFVVTHNLAASSNGYGVVANPSTDFGITKNANIGANSFEILFVDHNGNLLSTGFVFILTK